MRYQYAITFVLLTVWVNLSATVNKDSLLQIWNTQTVNDSIRLEAIHDVAWSYISVYPDSAIYYARMEGSFGHKTKHYKFEAFSLYTIGTAHMMKGETDSAIYYLEENCAMMERLGEMSSAGVSKSTIGAIYAREDRLYEALDYMYQSMAIFESLQDTTKIISASVNIGVIHKKLGEYSSALTHYFKGLAAATSRGNEYIQSICYINIGSVYLELDKPDSTDYYIDKAVEIQLRTNDIKGLGNSYNILANNFVKLDMLDSAKYYATRDLEIMKASQDKSAVSSAANILGLISYLENDMARSLFYHNLALTNAKESSSLIDQMQAHEGLSKVYEKRGNSKEAYLNYKLYILLRDSLNSEENLKALAQQEMKFQFTRKTLQDSLDYQNTLTTIQAEQEKQEAISKEVQQRNFVIQIASVVLVLLVAGIALVFYQANKRRKADNELISQQKEEVENQKHLLEEKNTEITDSITYAKRIQSAILPPLKLIQSELPDSFVLYLPKDIVAGDFYWAEKTRDQFFLAVSDCTGHGVPGALVSVVCHNSLNRSMREFGLTSPEKILDKTRDLVIDTFEKSEEQVKDGMDCALIALGQVGTDGSRELMFAGANNPIYLVQNGELRELKGDKQPVGKFDNARPFGLTRQRLAKGDLVFLVSDGFADQFGGSKGKKLKYQPLKDFLVNHHHLSMTELQQKLNGFFNDWRGPFEQVDDVCVVGVRV
ncbi:MAG: tetratricopeptide repeat protein [Bacteroidetes bacterium]|nr:tetratricopeptide repeat protein [Bacteroidota bacterium]